MLAGTACLAARSLVDLRFVKSLISGLSTETCVTKSDSGEENLSHAVVRSKAKTVRAHVLSEQFAEQAMEMGAMDLVVSRDPFPDQS